MTNFAKFIILKTNIYGIVILQEFSKRQTQNYRIFVSITFDIVKN